MSSPIDDHYTSSKASRYDVPVDTHEYGEHAAPAANTYYHDYHQDYSHEENLSEPYTQSYANDSNSERPREKLTPTHHSRPRRGAAVKEDNVDRRSKRRQQQQHNSMQSRFKNQYY